MERQCPALGSVGMLNKPVLLVKTGLYLNTRPILPNIEQLLEASGRNGDDC